jgi:NitT/TauT family transport system ATP-binding protein
VSAEPAVAVDGVALSFGAHAVLEGVSFAVQRGEFVALMGPSGCGKSSLLRLAVGLARPERGAVRVHGFAAGSPEGKRACGLVFQRPALLPWRTLEDNVRLPLELGVKAARGVAEVLAMVGLAGYERHLPAQLSGGMQQRAALARALVAAPEVLLLDEPFGALDELTRDRLNLELAGLWASVGTTVLLVTHGVEEAVFLSDRVVVLGGSPARVAGEVRVDLPRPRTGALRRDAAYRERVEDVRQLLGVNTP